MSRKAQNFRAWRYQNPNATVREAWEAGWDSRGARSHALTVQQLEQEVVRLRAQVQRLRASRNEAGSS